MYSVNSFAFMLSLHLSVSLCLSFTYSHSSTLKIKDTKKYCSHDKQEFTLINITHTPAHMYTYNGGISDPLFEISC